jgi:hypothetical protein
MKRSTFGAFWFGAACAVAVHCPAQTVQLADGRVLMAEVEPGSASGEGMRVKRLDNGGTLDLRWDHLSPTSALYWKKKFDLAGDSQDEFLVPAYEVEYLQSGGVQRLIGRLPTEDRGDPLVVTVKGVQYKVPRTELRGVRKVDAPVAQVLTKDEFYAERTAVHQPGNDADKHVLLAEDLIKVRDYEHATVELLRAKELGNSKNPANVDAMLAKLQRYKDAEKELNAIEEIRMTRSRGGLAGFEKGVKLIAQFEKDYPQTKLKSEFETEKKRFADERARFLTGQVAEQWRRSVSIVAEKAITGPALTLEAAKDYAQNKMTDDIVARLVATMKLDAAEIKKLWAERKSNVLGKRTETFTYGVGSWVLGSENILKDTAAGKEINKQDPKANEAANPNNPDMAKFAKLLKEALKRRQQAMQGQGAGGQEQTEEDWWRQAERTEKINWLRAYYAEYGGQLKVTFATVTPCISCYGEGTIPEIGPEGKMIRNQCFLCQSTKYLRRFQAY